MRTWKLLSTSNSCFCLSNKFLIIIFLSLTRTVNQKHWCVYQFRIIYHHHHLQIIRYTGIYTSTLLHQFMGWPITQIQNWIVQMVCKCHHCLENAALTKLDTQPCTSPALRNLTFFPVTWMSSLMLTNDSITLMFQFFWNMFSFQVYLTTMLSFPTNPAQLIE